ncbi:MAG: endonuclease MutS2, partial [Myxococcaceae bacterium]
MNAGVRIAERSLDDLGWAEIVRSLAGRCRTEPGHERALKRPFLETASEVHGALTLVGEARRLHEEPLLLPLTGVSEVRPSLERAAKGALLEPRELIAVTHALFSFERVREALEQRREALPSLFAVGRRVPELEKLATRLDRCFEASGEISDRASPELREARERTRGLHRGIKARLEKLLHDEKFAANLREGYFSVRNDRYVLPVLAQHRAEVPGLVHNASQSGQTLFVEPQELIGIGNDLAIAQSLVVEEERRILLELSGAVGQASGPIAEGVEACAALDEAEAAARLASDLEAHAPEVELPEGPLELTALRHPLLVVRGVEVVANDVRLSGEVRSLVISGPNAGGKTVTLTAVGLCALMMRAGLPVTAAPGSRVPLFRSVHSAVGDAQDLEKGLSTFSAHVTRLREIGESAAAGSLVLIDEIAADTDPREGAAIAIAVLEDLLERGAVVLVTTHLEELKALAHLDRRFVN